MLKFAMGAMDSPVDGEAAVNSVSLKGGDSNMMILPGKKNKNKGKNQVLGKGKKRDTPKLSKSQQRKLRRLEEEKVKDILLSKSMETLEKYKIREDAYSLMWSSANLGQVETVREKRRREVQFAKTGLVLAQSDRPAKRRAGKGAYNEIESESESNQIESKQGCNGNDSPQPVLRVREIAPDKPDPRVYTEEYLACGNRVDAVGVSDGIILDKDLANENINTLMLEDQQSPLLTSSNGRNIPNSREGVNKIHDATMSCGSNPVDCPSNRTLRTPTVVHVSRPKEVEENRTNLPIVMMEQEIMEAINDNTSVIICGETGCGKTTQVPQFLFEAGYGSKDNTVRSGIIGVTQPRRVAVLATAKRVAFELGLRLGKEVGFQVRYDKRVGDNCSIKFMTDGILLRELLTDFLLKKYSTIILDEAHERSLNTDILIGMLSRIIQTRQKIYEDQNKYEHLGGTVSPETRIFPLRLILMSATLRVEDFVSGRRIFSNPPPVIEVPTRQYPVTIHFSKRTEIVDYIGQAYKKVMSIHKRLPPGGILVFVTGQREVEFLCQKLHKASREMTKSKVNKEVPVATEDDYNNGFDMKELDEAFQIQENSTDQQTDRFSSFDGDYDENYEDDFDSSYDSDDDSDFEVLGIDGDSLEQQNLGNVADILGEDGKLTSLKAAFEALAGKNTLVDSEANQVIPSAPGAQDQSTSSSEKKESPSAMCVFPLYAMLPASAQLRVFEQIKEGERLVVVATNVAETSLTIPGIKYVVDTGREKVKNYNSSNGMESYEIQWISKASAAQRSGRAGRTGPGHCYRLYSSAVFNNIFADFSGAEISKIPVDGVVLLMKSMGIDKVANFPFPTPPEVTALIEAERCLKALEALDTEGRMTPLGKAMARYPMSPRHSRMLLTTIQIMKKGKYYARRNLVLGYAVAAAAALSVSNPFVIQFEGSQTDTDGSNDQKSDVSGSEKTLHKEEKMKKKKLKELSKVSREKFSNPTSDALSIAYALQCFELSESQVEFCNDNALHLKTMEEMSKLRKQLMNLVFNQSVCDSSHEFSWDYGTMEDVESAWKEFSDKTPLFLNEEELLGQAICAGWADRVARRIRGVSRLSEGERKVSAMRYQACMVKETVFLHRWSNLSRTAPEFLIYNELVHSKRPYIHGATSVKPDWLVKYARSLCSFSAPLPDPKPYYEPVTDEVFNWVTPTFGPHLWQLPLHSLPVKDDFHRVAVFAYSLLEGIVLPCVKRARKFMAASPAIILKPEASGHKRVGNLLSKMKTRSRTIYSCAMLRKVWTEKPKELYPEILDWFQVGFHDQYDDFWAGMQREVQLDPQERFPKLAKKEKNRKKSSSVKSRIRVV